MRGQLHRGRHISFLRAAAPMSHHDTLTDEVWLLTPRVEVPPPPPYPPVIWAGALCNHLFLSRLWAQLKGICLYINLIVEILSLHMLGGGGGGDLQPEDTVRYRSPSITCRWPLCSPDIDSSLHSPLSNRLPHGLRGGALCNQRWVWLLFTHASLLGPPSSPPHTRTSHLRGYRHGPGPSVTGLDSRKEF